MKPVCSFLFILRDIFQRKSPSLVERLKNEKKEKIKGKSEYLILYPSAREDLPLTEGYKSQATLSLMAEILNTENGDLLI